MKSLSLLLIAFALGLGAGDAEAKRLGGGKSIGMQRQMTPPPAKPVQAAPAPTAPSTAAAVPAKAAPPAASSGRSWMGPLAGLAAGLGLAALASHFGFGEELASLMLMLLISFAIFALVGFFMRKRMAVRQPVLAGAHGLHYSAERMEPTASGFDRGITHPLGRIPADFDMDGFVRSAKVHYLRLQAANNAGNLDEIRSFTTPEMFAEIKPDIEARQGATQETDVAALEAEVLEVVEEGGRYVASVRFTGQIREDGGPAVPLDEIWHLVKPIAGNGGWVLAGIQPLQ